MTENSDISLFDSSVFRNVLAIDTVTDVCSIAVFSEFLQVFAASRHAQFTDLVLNIFGIVLALFVLSLYNRLFICPVRISDY